MTDELPPRYTDDAIVRHLWDHYRFTFVNGTQHHDPFLMVVWATAQERVQLAADIRRKIESTVKGCTALLAQFDATDTLTEPRDNVYDVAALILDLHDANTATARIVQAYKKHQAKTQKEQQ